MADRIIELPVAEIRADPANPSGWVARVEALSATDGKDAERISTEIPIAASDTIATWEAKRRDVYRLVAGKPAAPVILLSYKVAP